MPEVIVADFTALSGGAVHNRHDPHSCNDPDLKREWCGLFAVPLPPPPPPPPPGATCWGCLTSVSWGPALLCQVEEGRGGLRGVQG